MTLEELEAKVLEIETNLQSVTDSTAQLDALVTGKAHMYFVCLHSGKYFPANYVKEWGRLYGVGLGRDVVSECLDSQYEVVPSLHNIRSLKQIMHPVVASRAPLDVIYLPEPAPESELLIPAYQDKFGDARAEIIRANQLNNPANLIQVALAKADSEVLNA